MSHFNDSSFSLNVTSVSRSRSPRKSLETKILIHETALKDNFKHLLENKNIIFISKETNNMIDMLVNRMDNVFVNLETKYGPEKIQLFYSSIMNLLDDAPKGQEVNYVLLIFLIQFY